MPTQGTVQDVDYQINLYSGQTAHIYLVSWSGPPNNRQFTVRFRPDTVARQVGSQLPVYNEANLEELARCCIKAAQSTPGWPVRANWQWLERMTFGVIKIKMAGKILWDSRSESFYIVIPDPNPSKGPKKKSRKERQRPKRTKGQ